MIDLDYFFLQHYVAHCSGLMHAQKQLMTDNAQQVQYSNEYGGGMVIKSIDRLASSIKLSLSFLQSISADNHDEFRTPPHERPLSELYECPVS
jgi:hypothetical protein